MKLKVLSVSVALCVSILMAGARAGAAQEVQPLDPDWLRQMYEEGWHKLQEGVLQRDMGGGQLETFSYGDEGLSWVAQSLENRSRLLENRYAASPSNELAGTIDRLRDEIARLNVLAQDAPSAESFDNEALESCSPSYGGIAVAHPLPQAPGVTAQADAYFHSACGQLGNTYAYTYAHVTNGSTSTSKTEDDLKNAGTWLDSSATVSLQGSTGCESRAQAMVTSDELSISYMTPEATNYSCPPPWAAAYPPNTQMGLVSQIPAGPRPAYLMPVTENTNPSFGTQITRITDQAAFGSSSTVIRHHYSKTQPWNADGTRIMLTSRKQPLLDGNDYHIVRPTNLFSPMMSRWSHKDPNKVFQAWADSLYVITLNPLDNSQTETVLRTFPGYSDLSIGNAEGNLSIDDRLVALMGRKTTGPNGLNDLYVIIYDIENDAILAESRFDNKFTSAADRIDWVSVSQSGNYVLFSWSAGGTGRDQGVEVYQVVDGVLTFQRQLTPAAAHGDIGYDSFGNEVYVQSDFEHEANPGVGLSSYRLDNGARVTQLLEGGNNAPWQAHHVSCRNYKRPGWAYISTQSQQANLSTNSKEVLAVKLDGSLTVERFGWTHNHYLDYASEAHLVPNPNGTKIMFASNWDGTSTADPVYSYVAEWPQPPTVNGLLKENFEDGLANGWTPAGGTWSIVPDSTMGNHALRQSSTTAGAFSVSTPNFIGGTDYAIQARIKINAFGSSGSVQLHARYTDPGNYYYLLANGSQPTPQVQLKKKYLGVTTTLQVVPFTVDPGVWNTLKLQVDGTSIKGYVNGSLVVSVTDTDLTSGSARLGGNNVDVKFDDVVVSLADDFEDGNANGWLASSGTWSVMTDGSSVLTQSDSTAAQSNAYRGSPAWTNYGIEARIKIMTFGSNGSAALRVRFADAYNNYYLLLNGTQAVLKRKENGVTTTLSTQPFVANLNTWYKVKLVATGANIEGWIDGIRVISVFDSDPLPGGFAVLAGHNVDVRFDDVIVE